MPPDRAIEEGPYFKAVNAAAARLGFLPAGTFVQDRNSRMYQAHMRIWISRDHQSLLRITGGKTAGIENKRAWLTTFVEPNHIIETSDETMMADVSGLTDRKWVMNAQLEELVACHTDRINKHAGAKRAFSPHQADAACRAMQLLRVMEMEKLGLGRFINAEKTIWRHTLKGACIGYFKGFKKQLDEGKAQQHRMKLKRPGSK